VPTPRSLFCQCYTSSAHARHLTLWHSRLRAVDGGSISMLAVQVGDLRAIWPTRRWDNQRKHDALESV
jgi:hypothetical protein